MKREQKLIKLLDDVLNFDKEVYLHSINVAAISCVIGEELKLSESRIEMLLQAALLHDYGKLFIPKSILLTPKRLTPQEYSFVKEHVNYGILALKNVSGIPKTVLKAISEHHERLNGSGYPNRLTKISLFGKIIAVADFYDALTRDRCYKSACSVEYAKSQIMESGGNEFDVKVVEALQKNISTISVQRLSKYFDDYDFINACACNKCQ